MTNQDMPDDGNAGQVASAVQGQGQGAVQAPQPNQVPKIILVVDDELFQLKKSHVNGLAADFYATIADVTDPAFENLWDVARC